VRLIQFLMRKQAEHMASAHPERPGRKEEYFEVPVVIKDIYPWWYKPGDVGGSEVFMRPSAVAGANYMEVSKDYSRALHSVLARQTTAPAATAALEKELVAIMGQDRVQAGSGSH
jgi:hypothetical protein